LLAAARTDHLCGESPRDKLLLEPQECLQPVRLFRVVAEPNRLDPEALDLLLELAILLPHPTQVKVTMPEIAAASLKPDNTLFQRSYRIHGPDAD